ncbi:MAG: protein kinase [bacterium]
MEIRPPDPIVLGPFDLLRPAGSGATAVVWRGVHRASAVPVAVKVMTLPATDRGSGPAARARAAQFRDLFAREVRAMATLDHPGIIRVHDHGVVPGAVAEASRGRLAADAPFMVMDWIDGGTLADVGDLGWSEARAIVFALLDALAHAHARGVIHRDLKPRNVLMGGRGPVLTDFGIVHQTSLEGRRGGTVRAGTPGYMAPEQIKHDPRRFGPWTDLYALGCVAYEMVSGFLPHAPRGPQSADALLAPTREEPEPLEPRMSVPAGFERWLRRMLAREPAQRFRYAADAARALAALGSPLGPDRRARVAAPSTLTGIAALVDDDDVDELDPEMTLKDNLLRFESVALTGSLELEPTLDESIEEIEPIAGPEPGDVDSFAPLRARPGDPFEDAESTLDEAAARSASTWIDPSTLVRPASTGSLGAQSARVPVPSDWQRPDVPPPVRLWGTGSALADLREPSLRGRTAERTVLWRTLDAVTRDERPRAVLIRGGAGFGKTRLGQWLSIRTHELAVAESLVATHSPASGVATGLGAMLARHARSEGVEGPALVEHFIETIDAPPPLAIVAAALVSRDRSIALDERTVTLWTEEEAIRAMSLVLQHLAARRTLVVRIEDAQWGEEAVRFVDAVLARNPRLPALFVLTARDGVPGPAGEALLRLAARPATRTVTLGPLDAAAQGELLDDRIRLEPETRARLVARAAGHPLFATELCCHWARAGVLESTPAGYRLRAGDGDRLADLDAVWDARLADVLGPFTVDTQWAFEVAAVLGTEVATGEWKRACALAGLPMDEVRWALERLVEGRLIHLLGERRWAFTHGLLREALERRAAVSGRLMRWHAFCAAMLRSEPEPDLRRLRNHLVRAGEPSAALPLVMRRVEGALGREDLVALRRLVIEGVRLLWRIGVGLDEREGIRLRATWAWLMAQVGSESAARQGERALAASQAAGDHGAVALALAALGQVVRTRDGDAVQAAVHLRRAMTAALKARDARLVARCSRQLCTLLETTGRLDEAEAVLDAVEKMPGADDDPREQGLRRLRRAAIALHRRLLPTARVHATAARDAFVQDGMRTDVMLAENLLGEIASAAKDGTAADLHYGIAHDIARELDHADAPIYQVNRGRVLLDAGRYDEARSRLVVALREASRRDAWLATMLARLSLLPCAAHARHWSSWDTQWACLEPLRSGRYVHRDVARIARIAARLADAAGEPLRAAAARRLAVDQYARLGLVTEAQATRDEGQSR